MPAPDAETPPLLRAVLDTNVYVSGAILSRGTPFALLEVWRWQACILVTSEAIIAEVERVLRYWRSQSIEPRPIPRHRCSQASRIPGAAASKLL